MIDFLRRQLLCSAGIFHKYEITRTVNNKGQLVDYIRYCEVCKTVEALRKPKKYHPSSYVWTRINERE